MSAPWIIKQQKEFKRQLVNKARDCDTRTNEKKIHFSLKKGEIKIEMLTVQLVVGQVVTSKTAGMKSIAAKERKNI